MGIEDLEFHNEESKQYLKDLSKMIKNRQVVLFAGAGLSKNAIRKDCRRETLPLWEHIAEKMLKKLYPGDIKRINEEKLFYFDVADKFETEFGRNEVNQLLKEVINDFQFQPGEIHRLICKFDWEIITTNFDTLLERAFESVRKDSNVIYNDSHLTGKKTPCIYKINGCIKNAIDEIIITGEDFRRFSEKKPLIELYVKKCFIESTVLFVGFSLNDPAFQTIHGWVRDRLFDKKTTRFAYSIQTRIDKTTKKLWQNRNIHFVELFPSGKINKNDTGKRLYEIFDALYRSHENSVKQKKELIEDQLETLEKCFVEFKKGSNDKVNDLLQLLKDIITSMEETGGQIFDNKEITKNIKEIFDKFLMNSEQVIENRNIWVLAMYIALRSGVSQKLFSIDFFRKGFSILGTSISSSGVDNAISVEFHHYWMIVLICIGPLKCTEKVLKVSRKRITLKYDWNIPEHVHFHLETFYGNIAEDLDLFLKSLHNFVTSEPQDSFYKFHLLDTFLKKYEDQGFSDLFLKNTYQELSGRFHEKSYLFRNTLSSISFPLKKKYFEAVIQAIFTALNNGKSFLFTGISHVVLSLPAITINKNDIEAFKQTSLGEIFLIAVIYDKPAKIKEDELKHLIRIMIDSGIIDVPYFLRLLLFRLEESTLENMEQKADNGISRYLHGLVSFIQCALPYLDEAELMEIKKAIETHIININLKDVRESIVEIISYIYNQLPGEGFSKIFKTIFSLAARADYASLGLRFLKLSPQTMGDPGILKYSQLRLILDQSLENQGSPFDRDFIKFMLHHKIEDIFPGDERVVKTIKNYFDIKIKEQKHLSLQWLMDLQRFIEKGFIQLDREIEKKITEFIEAAFNITSGPREWKIFSTKMIPVYKTFAHLFSKDVISKITAGYLLDYSTGKAQKITLKELDETTQNSFAHLLKEIYYYYQSHDDKKDKDHVEFLNNTVIKTVKKFTEAGLTGGGHLGAFWERLAAWEQKQLIKAMKDLWMPPSEENILKAVKTAGEFLKYKTDEETMKEISSRLLYAVFSGSTAVKIAWCKIIAVHIEEGTSWYLDHKERIINCLDYLKMEEDLELLRQFLELLTLLKKEDINLKEKVTYLKKNAPYAEIRRAAGRF